MIRSLLFAGRAPDGRAGTPRREVTGPYCDLVPAELLQRVDSTPRGLTFAPHLKDVLTTTGSTLALVPLASALPYLPFAPAPGFTPLSLPILALLSGITILYVGAAELAKKGFHAHAA